MSITLQTLKELLIVPHEIIVKKAKAKDRNEALVILIINWILIAIGVSLISSNYSFGLAMLVFGIIGTLISAFFIYLAFAVIGEKGDYVSALIALTYPFFGVSFSTLVISLIYLWSNIASFFIGAILFLLYFTVAIIGMFRVLKESFKTDLITVWIVITLVSIAILLTIYGLLIIYSTQYLTSAYSSKLAPYLISRLV